MALRFAILKRIGKDDDKLVLEYDAVQVLTRLQSRIAENLSHGGQVAKKAKFKHTREEVHKAVELSFNGLIAEFKEETIKLV